MLKSLLSSAALISGVVLAATSQAAVIVNIDATNPTNDQTIMLAAGDYSIDLVDDIAWSAWSNTTGCGVTPGDCTTGWINRFFIESADLGTIAAGLLTPGNRYSTPSGAVSAFGTIEFSLPSEQDVTFDIRDSNFTDNRGGLRLEITEVSEPGALALLSLGIAGLAVARRRK